MSSCHSSLRDTPPPESTSGGICQQWFPRPALAVGKQIEPGAGVPRRGAEDMSPVELGFLCAHPFLLGSCDVDFLWTKSRGGHPLSPFSGPAQTPSPLHLHGATGGCGTGRAVVAGSPGVLAGPGPCARRLPRRAPGRHSPRPGALLPPRTATPQGSPSSWWARHLPEREGPCRELSVTVVVTEL